MSITTNELTRFNIANIIQQLAAAEKKNRNLTAIIVDLIKQIKDKKIKNILISAFGNKDLNIDMYCVNLKAILTKALTIVKSDEEDQKTLINLVKELFVLKQELDLKTEVDLTKNDFVIGDYVIYEIREHIQNDAEIKEENASKGFKYFSANIPEHSEYLAEMQQAEKEYELAVKKIKKDYQSYHRQIYLKAVRDHIVAQKNLDFLNQTSYIEIIEKLRNEYEVLYHSFLESYREEITAHGLGFVIATAETLETIDNVNEPIEENITKCVEDYKKELQKEKEMQIAGTCSAHTSKDHASVVEQTKKILKASLDEDTARATLAYNALEKENEILLQRIFVTIKTYIERININDRSEKLNTPIEGSTLFDLACYYGHQEVADYLLSQNACGQKKSGQTAIIMRSELVTCIDQLAMNADEAILEVITSYKYCSSLLNSIRGKSGNTICHVIVEAGKWNIFEILIAMNVDVNVKNNQGLTPFMLLVNKITNPNFYKRKLFGYGFTFDHYYKAYFLIFKKLLERIRDPYDDLLNIFNKMTNFFAEFDNIGEESFFVAATCKLFCRHLIINRMISVEVASKILFDFIKGFKGECKNAITEIITLKELGANFEQQLNGRTILDYIYNTYTKYGEILLSKDNQNEYMNNLSLTRLSGYLHEFNFKLEILLCNKEAVVLIVGKDKVGKSSLMNVLAHANVAQVAGDMDTTTGKAAHSYNNIAYIDTPGFGSKKFPAGTIEEFFRGSWIQNVDIILFACFHNIEEVDRKLLDQIIKLKKPWILVQTHREADLDGGCTRSISELLAEHQFKFLSGNKSSSAEIPFFKLTLTSSLQHSNSDYYKKFHEKDNLVNIEKLYFQILEQVIKLRQKNPNYKTDKFIEHDIGKKQKLSMNSANVGKFRVLANGAINIIPGLDYFVGKTVNNSILLKIYDYFDIENVFKQTFPTALKEIEQLRNNLSSNEIKQFILKQMAADIKCNDNNKIIYTIKTSANIGLILGRFALLDFEIASSVVTLGASIIVVQLANATVQTIMTKKDAEDFIKLCSNVSQFFQHTTLISNHITFNGKFLYHLEGNIYEQFALGLIDNILLGHFSQDAQKTFMEYIYTKSDTESIVAKFRKKNKRATTTENDLYAELICSNYKDIAKRCHDICMSCYENNEIGITLPTLIGNYYGEKSISLKEQLSYIMLNEFNKYLKKIVTKLDIINQYPFMIFCFDFVMQELIKKTNSQSNWAQQDIEKTFNSWWEEKGFQIYLSSVKDNFYGSIIEAAILANFFNYQIKFIRGANQFDLNSCNPVGSPIVISVEPERFFRYFRKQEVEKKLIALATMEKQTYSKPLTAELLFKMSSKVQLVHKKSHASLMTSNLKLTVSESNELQLLMQNMRNALQNQFFFEAKGNFKSIVQLIFRKVHNDVLSMTEQLSLLIEFINTCKGVDESLISILINSVKKTFESKCDRAESINDLLIHDCIRKIFKNIADTLLSNKNVNEHLCQKWRFHLLNTEAFKDPRPFEAHESIGMIPSKQSSIKNSVPETLDDGNCAFNAFALGLCSVAERGELTAAELRAYEQLQADLELPAATQSAFQDWLASHSDPKYRQQILQKSLRKIAISFIEDNYEIVYRASYEDALFAVYENRNTSGFDDTFVVHKHIQEKFAENPSENDLKKWWGAEGKDTYFNNIRNGVGLRISWGGETEIDVLATVFGLNVCWVKGTGGRMVGIGNGFVDGLSPEEISKLQLLGIGRQFGSRFKLEPFENCKKLEQMMLPIAASKLLEHLENSNTTELPDFITNASLDFQQQLETRGIITKSYKLISAGGPDQVDKKRILAKLNGIRDRDLFSKILAAYKPIESYVVLAFAGAHWQYQGIEHNQAKPALLTGYNRCQMSNINNSSNGGFIGVEDDFEEKSVYVPNCINSKKIN